MPKQMARKKYARSSRSSDTANAASAAAQRRPAVAAAAPSTRPTAAPKRSAAPHLRVVPPPAPPAPRNTDATTPATNGGTPLRIMRNVHVDAETGSLVPAHRVSTDARGNKIDGKTGHVLRNFACALVDTKTGRVLEEGGYAGSIDGRPAWITEASSPDLRPPFTYPHDFYTRAVPLEGRDPQCIVTVKTARPDMWGLRPE